MLKSYLQMARFLIAVVQLGHRGDCCNYGSMAIIRYIERPPYSHIGAAIVARTHPPSMLTP